MSRRRGRVTRPAAAAPRPGGRRKAWIGVGSLLSLAAGAALLLRPAAGGGDRPRSRDNLLLITLDTARADRLGCYGYAKAKTRHLDRLAAEGVRFETALSPAPITLPAHASIFTGLYPFAHGVRNNGNFYLSERYETLATVLKKQGYRTAAFVSTFILDRRYGLARGFDVYDDLMEGAQPQVLALEAERRGDRTALALTRWLETNAGAAEPFFVWLHLYDPHEPYRPPPPFRDLFAADPYDGEIAFDDAVVAAVLDALGRVGARDRTLVAVIADHGESLGDHGEETHTMFVYESAVRVPLILWRPGALPSGRVVSAPVRATDLAPTLLELLGAPPLTTGHGRSLVALIEGNSAGPSPPSYSETYVPQLYMNWAPLRAVRDDRWKLIDAPRPELYDLARDPGETRNLHHAEPQRAGALRTELDRLTAGGAGEMAVGTLDREAAEKLAALGYLGAGAAPPPSGGGVDPKDRIRVFNRLRRANSAVRDRRFEDALPVLREVLAEDPRNAFARLVMGSAYMGMGRNQEAIGWYRRYLEVVPTSSYAHQWMAICHVRLGEKDAALREAEAALAIDPRFTDARVLKGGVLASRGAHDAAVHELRIAVETDPAKPMLRLDLAKVLAEAGRSDEALAVYDALLKQQPDYAPALTGLGALQAKRADLEAAERSLRHAVELDPLQDDARFNLARVLEQRGRPTEAVTEYRRLVEAPHTAPAVRAAARQRLAALGR